ncbi:hypothetical protein AOLI_G00056200 [Acnodon oligacanthus]
MLVLTPFASLICAVSPSSLFKFQTQKYYELKKPITTAERLAMCIQHRRVNSARRTCRKPKIESCSFSTAQPQQTEQLKASRSPLIVTGFDQSALCFISFISDCLTLWE